MNKKFLSLVLALVMVLGTLTPVFAEEAAPKDKIEKAAKTAASAKVQWLVDQKIVSGRKLFKDGDEKSDLALDKNLQRAEITRLLVLGKGLENLANLVQGTMRPYLDVDNSHWANGVITVGSYHLKNTQNVPMLAGYPGNKFLPDRNVSYAELVKMLVVLVDNSITPKMVEKFDWPSDWMVRAANLGILAGIEVKDSNAFVTRQVAFEMVYNALYLYDTRSNIEYGDKIGVVSGYKNGELMINQGDKAFSVKYNENTVYTQNSGFVGYMPLAGNHGQLQLGSLVRVIADKDGYATHIIELGNPSEGYIKQNLAKGIDRWYGVADKQVEGFADCKDINNSVIKVYDNTFKSLETLDKKEYKDLEKVSILKQLKAEKNNQDVAAPVSVTLTSNTKYFVADANRRFLTEVDKDKAQQLVKKYYYGSSDKLIPNVYVGYDAKKVRTTEYTEARIVVFNVVDKVNWDKNSVRVVNLPDSTFSFTGQKTDGKEVVYNVRGYGKYFPGSMRAGKDTPNTSSFRQEFAMLNVVALDQNLGTNEVFNSRVVINHENDPIFQVVGQDRLYANVYELALRGKGGVLSKVVMDLENTTVFLDSEKDNLKDRYIQLPADQLNGDKVTGYYTKEYKLPDTVSVLPGFNWEARLANVNADYAQNKEELLVTIKGLPGTIEGPKYVVYSKDVNFYVEKDEFSRTPVEKTQRYYVISAEDYAELKTIMEKADLVDATFRATLYTSNVPGGEAHLRFYRDVTTKKIAQKYDTMMIHEPADKVALATKGVVTAGEFATIKTNIENANVAIKAQLTIKLSDDKKSVIVQRAGQADVVFTLDKEEQ